MYLIARYLATVHIMGLKTQYFSFVKDKKIEDLKVLLWKIMDELTTMDHEDRRSHEMRLSERQVLALQEHLTVGDVADSAKTLLCMKYTEFLRRYYSNIKKGEETSLLLRAKYMK